MEGTRLQLESTSDKTRAIVVSTLMEAHAVVKGGLVADKTVDDVGYSSYVWIHELTIYADSIWVAHTYKQTGRLVWVVGGHGTIRCDNQSHGRPS